MKATPFLVLNLLGIVLVSAATVHGFEVQFPSASPTTVPPPSYTVQSPGYGTPTPTYGTPSPTYGTQPPYGSPAPSGTTAPPAYGAPAAPSMGTVPSAAGSPPVYGPPPPVIPGQVAGPVPTAGGTVAPPPPNWDPYAPACSGEPATLLPQDYYPTPPAVVAPERLQRLIDEVRLDYHLLAARGSKSFGTNDLELSTTFAFPFFYNPETPIRITPGFAFHWWEGPVGTDIPDGILHYLPPRVYDAYLDAAWNPQVTPQVGGELAFRVGVYSDFDKVTTECLRYTGHGLFVLSLSPSFKIKAGIVYYDRVRIKMLPAGGVVWTPNPDTEFSIIFPEPSISRRLSNYGNTEWWLYCRGEYGGGSWVMKPDKLPNPPLPGDPPDVNDQVDYNDIRFAVGLKFDRMDRIAGLLEVGTAFDRELVVRSTGAKYSPSTTIFLRAGLIR